MRIEIQKAALSKDEDLTCYKLKEVTIHIYDAANFSYMKFLAFGLSNSNKFSFGTCNSFQIFADLFCFFLLFQVDVIFGEILKIAEEPQ